MKRSLNLVGLALIAVTLLALTGTSLYGQGQSQNQPPVPRVPGRTRPSSGGTTSATG